MIPESIAAKVAGSVAGTILALVFIVPKTLSGFIRRISASLVGGMVFGPSVHYYGGWPASWEHLMASAAIASFLCWFVMGHVVTLAKKLLADKAQQDAE